MPLHTRVESGSAESAVTSAGGSFLSEERSVHGTKETGIIIPFTTRSQPILELQHTYAALRCVMEDRVQRNDFGLEVALITRHSWDHMNRVSGAAWEMGEAIGFTRDQMIAVALSGNFHDIGYVFPEGEDPAMCSKETHVHHPQVGAALFMQELQRLRATNSEVEQELDWWSDAHDQLARETILHHSNGSLYDENTVSDPAKLIRLMDKGDNANARLYISQIVACGVAAGMSIERVNAAIRENIAQCLHEDVGPLPLEARQRKIGDTYEALATKFDPSFPHHLVSYAITDQRAVFFPCNGGFSFEYTVKPDRLSCLLGAKCTAEDFLALFVDAYGNSSMRRAAEVIFSIRNRVLNLQTGPQEETLGVTFHFPRGEQHTIQYTPQFQKDIISL